ncbi:hypothetical protein GH733_012390 [Mirounga leonina]|nr:hypothetical protein GH733_012390 [Mirounga leonina]
MPPLEAWRTGQDQRTTFSRSPAPGTAYIMECEVAKGCGSQSSWPGKPSEQPVTFCLRARVDDN